MKSNKETDEPNVKQVFHVEIDNYVNWKAIVEDYNLKSGDLTIEQDIALNNIIKSFIMQNMNEWRNNDL
jgi:hypothetical protein